MLSSCLHHFAILGAPISIDLRNSTDIRNISADIKYNRLINILEPLKERSLFLLGPLQTGKSTLLQELFPSAAVYDLLQANQFQELSADPTLIRQRLKSSDTLVVIDEVQKLPILLDEVHSLIQRNSALRFVLTGSSARKLRRGGVNLLAGRARIRYLHPLVSPELNYDRLLERLERGGLPFIIDSSSPREDLQTYCGTYLQEEIRAESLVRSIENFSRFLLVAGLTNGTQLNYENVARDAGLAARTVREYYQILCDTLVGHIVEPFGATTRRKAVGIPKFYLFDLGVANFLTKTGEIQKGSKSCGDAIEHLVFLELKAFLDYQARDLPLSYWRSTTKFEVDFTIGDTVAVEVKAKSRVTDPDLKGLRALNEEGIFKRLICVSDETSSRTTDDGIEIIPIQEFLRALWSEDIVISA
jgi:predicted AAA+ superfamily ATPase